MARRPDLVHKEQDAIQIAVGAGLDKALDMPGCFPLGPSPAPAGPVDDAAGDQRLPKRLRAHPRLHQDFARVMLLRDNRYKPSLIIFERARIECRQTGVEFS